MKRRLLSSLAGAALMLIGPNPSDAQTPQDTVGACIPVAERAGRPFGCFILSAAPVGAIDPAEAFWHLETFPTVDAATKAKPAHGLVVEAFEKVWLLTIARTGWRSTGGTHVAEIGPLPITKGTAYAAQFMEATFKPGMKSRIHRHSGAEAWYTLNGETCLETPAGSTMSKPGTPVIVPEGPPMELTATGPETRRSLVLILHDTSRPHTTIATDWTPKGLCKG